MKKTIIFTFTYIIIISCNFNNKKNESNNVERTEISPAKKSLIVSKITSNEIPNSITYKGKFKEGYVWQNRNENNIVFITETGEFQNKTEDDRSAELFSYCYDLNSNTTKLNWKVYDFIKDCPVDIITKFTDNTFTITDLNNNGIAEVWLMYEIACKGDVSPNNMKIIMYEGKQKFAMRGENKIQIGIDENDNPIILGGEYKFDKAFSKGPEVFKNYAEKLWSKNL